RQAPGPAGEGRRRGCPLEGRQRARALRFLCSCPSRLPRSRPRPLHRGRTPSERRQGALHRARKRGRRRGGDPGGAEGGGGVRAGGSEKAQSYTSAMDSEAASAVTLDEIGREIRDVA